jgi:hypothetical protein
MRIGGSHVAASPAYESPRVDAQKAQVRMWIGEVLSNQHVPLWPPAVSRTAESDHEKRFEPALLDWFIFLKTKLPGSDPMAGIDGVEEIRRLYQKAGPSYVAPPAKVAKPSPKGSAAFDVVA